jgi:cellulose synthase operon protein C
VKADPTQPAGHLALVNRLVLAGNGAAAVTAAQEASVALPQDAPVIDALGRAQLAAGDARGALASFKRLTTMQPAEPMHLVRLAQAQGAMGDADAAAGSLRQALKLQPEHGLAQRNLALLLVQGNRVSEAVALARAQQQKNPKDSAAFALEGELQSAANNPAAAAAAYREALKRQPGDSNLAVRAHRHLVAAGAADAQRMADDWLRANPQDLLFTYHLGDMAVAAKDWPRAEQHFRKVLQLQPRQAAGMNNLAYVMAAQRKPGAVAMAEQAVALLPDRAPLLDTLAFAQEAEGKLDLAVVTQQRAVALDPKAPELRLHLAQLLAKQGQKAEALKLLEALDTLGPAFPSQAEVAALMKTLR